MIDKTSSQWNAMPLWVRVTFWGPNNEFLYSKRPHLIKTGIFFVASGTLACSLSFLEPFMAISNLLLGGGLLQYFTAAVFSIYIRLADKVEIWQ